MENPSEEFLLFWRKETSEEEDNREQDEEKKKIRARWKPSEMKLFMELKLLVRRKKMVELEKLYDKKMTLKEAGEKGLRACNKLLAYYRKYTPDYLKSRDDWIATNPDLEFEDISEYIIPNGPPDPSPALALNGPPLSARHYAARWILRVGPCRASCLTGGPGPALWPIFWAGPVRRRGMARWAATGPARSMMSLTGSTTEVAPQQAASAGSPASRGRGGRRRLAA
jgi:hypothetical protein